MICIGRILALPLTLVGVVACGGAPAVEVPANEVEIPVKRYISFYFNDYRRGLPGESQLPKLASFVTPELLALFEAANRGEDCYARQSNYEGPPAIEGDLFTSLFEGATSATYREIARDADTATFEIEWTFHDEHLSPEPFTWQDRVFLANTRNGWRIADFAHDGDWEFMKDASVSQILQAVANECES